MPARGRGTQHALVGRPRDAPAARRALAARRAGALTRRGGGEHLPAGVGARQVADELHGLRAHLLGRRGVNHVEHHRAEHGRAVEHGPAQHGGGSGGGASAQLAGAQLRRVVARREQRGAGEEQAHGAVQVRVGARGAVAGHQLAAGVVVNNVAARRHGHAELAANQARVELAVQLRGASAVAARTVPVVSSYSGARQATGVLMALLISPCQPKGPRQERWPHLEGVSVGAERDEALAPQEEQLRLAALAVELRAAGRQLRQPARNSKW